jgi:uncharacterized protein (UPF0335 family)
MDISGVSSEYLKQTIDKIERLEEDRAAVTQDIKQVYDEAKIHGFDVKILKQVVKLRKLDRDDRAEQEALLETYKRAIGML